MATRTSFTSGADADEGMRVIDERRDEGSSARRRILDMLQGYGTRG
jgi:hypothetical protein